MESTALAVFLTILLSFVPAVPSTTTSGDYSTALIEAAGLEETEPSAAIEEYVTTVVDPDAWAQAFVSLWDEAHTETIEFEMVPLDESTDYPTLAYALMDDWLGLELYQSTSSGEYWFSVQAWEDDIPARLANTYESYVVDCTRFALIAQYPDLKLSESREIESKIYEIIEGIKAEEEIDTYFYYGNTYITVSYSAEYGYLDCYICF